MPRARLVRQGFAAMMLLVVAALAVGACLPSPADHPATETHVDADHGPHDGPAVSGDQRAESRTALQALPAAPPLLAGPSGEGRATRPHVAERLPGHPPPQPVPARSPPRSV